MTQPRPTPPPNPFERLEASLQQVRAQPIESAEYTELATQYQAEIDKLDDSPASAAIRPRLQQRLAWLQGMADLQALRRRVADDAAAAGTSRGTVEQRLADVARNRQYTVVGRLTTSTIYDGTRLPLMYRVQASGAGTPRTLAYVKPDPNLRLETRVGQIVGIIGPMAIDTGLNLNIITPTRVDVLEAAPAQPPAATANPPQ